MGNRRTRRRLKSGEQWLPPPRLSVWRRWGRNRTRPQHPASCASSHRMRGWKRGPSASYKRRTWCKHDKNSSSNNSNHTSVAILAQPALGGKDQGPSPVHFPAAPRSDDFVPCLASAMESAGVTPPAPLRGLPRSLASQGVWQLTPEQFGECPLHVSPDLPQIVVCRGRGGCAR